MAKRVSEAVQIEQEKTRRETNVEIYKSLGTAAGILAASPLFQMVAFAVTIEALQKIKLPNGDPILSEFLGNALETTVITAKGLEAVGGVVSGILSKAGGVFE